MVTLTDPLANKISFTYDQRNLAATVTAPDGGVTHAIYDTDREALSVTDATGATRQATYDYLGRTSTSTVLERYPSSASFTTYYAYGAGGWLASITTPDNVKTTYGYDSAGQVISATDGANNQANYAYDFMGDLTKTTLPDGTSSEVNYNAMQQPVATINRDVSNTVLTRTSRVFDGLGNLLSSTDARGSTTTFHFDAAGRLGSETQPVTGTSSITTGFGYDAAGNRTRYTDGRGVNWITTYNSWNLPESKIEPTTATYTAAADSTFTTAYDADGHPVTETAPGGVSTAYTYDAAGNLTGQSGSGAEAPTATRSVHYDLGGRIVSAGTTAAGSQPATSDTFTYNDRGLLLTATGSAGSSSFSYNSDGQMASRTDASGTSSYNYDSAGRLSTVNDAASGTTLTYGYNQLDQVNKITYAGSGDTRTLGYDSLHRLTSDTLATAASAGAVTVASIGYQWDANNNLTAKTTTGFTGSTANTYDYDFANRLTSWNNGTTAVAYNYDGNSNRTQVGSTTYNYDARNQLTTDGTTTFAYSARGTQTAGAGGTTAAFDAYGQDVTTGVQTYTYDALGRAISAATSGGATRTLAYSGPGNIVASDGTNLYSRGPGGDLEGIGAVGQGTGSGLTAWTDLHHDVVADFTATGTTLTGSAAYDPLGNKIGTSSLTGSLGYQGEYTDRTTGNVNMDSRWYSPATGQFTSRDTISNSPVPNSAAANPFAYGNGNPLTASDPTGHMDDGMEGGGSSATPNTGPTAVSYAPSLPPAVSDAADADIDKCSTGGCIHVHSHLIASNVNYLVDITVKNLQAQYNHYITSSGVVDAADHDINSCTSGGCIAKHSDLYANDPSWGIAQAIRYAQAKASQLADADAAKRVAAANRGVSAGGFLKSVWVGVDNSLGHALFKTAETLDPVKEGESWLHQQEHSVDRRRREGDQ